MSKKLFILFGLLTSLSLNTKNISYADATDFGREDIKVTENNFLDYFDVYCESGDPEENFIVRDNTIICKGKFESKLIYRQEEKLDNFVIYGEFSGGSDDYVSPIDAGFYFYANYPKNNIDGIVAYELNIEKGIYTNDFIIKLHKFENGYLGYSYEKSFVADSYPICLKLSANHGHVDYYLNNSPVPTDSFDLSGYNVGSVGLRFFRTCLSKVSNLKVYSENIEPNYDDFNEAMSNAKTINKDLYSALSVGKLSSIIDKYETSKPVDQEEIDMATKEINEAFKNLNLKKTENDLFEIIKTANDICVNETLKYTENSLNSLKSILEKYEKDKNSSEFDASYFYDLIKGAIDRLVSYDW